jgi:hypothetical protein
MSFLGRRGRLLIEAVGIMYAFLMVLLAIVEWAGEFAWRLAPSSLLMMAGVSIIGTIYLVLDEIRLNTRR